MQPIEAHEGLLAHLIRERRPDLAEAVEETGRIETAVIGLGGQGTRHAGLMQAYGTEITAGIAPGRGDERIHETIPVYDSMRKCLKAHPRIAAVSIWRHFSSARDAALEAIHVGVPLIVLITEGIPLRDVRDVISAARRAGTVLLGGNTPGAIFPPERIKIGMLPDVFHPEEPEPGRAGPRGVTILSRSGAILYHMSDALASAGIAQNGVIGVGGDGAIGSTFRDLIPKIMSHDPTELVVIAGEIGGAQEELLAEEIQAHKDRYPKSLVALISGAHAPEGKTMGHAGAIVSPGVAYGTFKSKRSALEAAGVTVVNSQYDLIQVAKNLLQGRTYFDTGDYYERMRVAWEMPPDPPSWGTLITGVEPNRLTVAGFALEEIVGRVSLTDAAHLLTKLELPAAADSEMLSRMACTAAAAPAPDLPGDEGEQLSTVLARYYLVDGEFATERDPAMRAAVALGRTVRYLARVLGNEAALDKAPADAAFDDLIARALGAEPDASAERKRLIEAMAVASIDHGVTPPSAQATILAATVRVPFAMGLASGVGAITDIHGGAGARAAEFFLAAVARAAEREEPVGDAALDLLIERSKAGDRVAGLGHRVHTQDPRRDVLWSLADEHGFSGPCVALSRCVEDLFEEARGFRLPINVDGVIGSVVADLGLPPVAAKALFILGRVAGLSAHYFEETRIQPPMRRIRFEDAVYRGPAPRRLAESGLGNSDSR